MSLYPFTTETMDRIIAAAAHSYAFVTSLVKHFTLDSLPTDQAKLVLRASLSLAERVSNVTPALLEQELHLLPAGPGDVSEALDYLQTCVDVYGPPSEKDSEELAALLGPMVRREVERQLLEDAVKLYGAGHSVADVASKVHDAQSIGTVRKQSQVFMGPDVPFHVDEESVSTLPTGISLLDEQFLDGGLEQCGLGLTLCETGGGKSMFLGHVAATAITMGKNVYVATLEMTENELKSRLYRNILGMSAKHLKENPKEASRRLALLNSSLPNGIGRSCISKFDPYVTSVAMLKQNIDRLPWVPELVIVDYVGRMKSSRGKGPVTDLNPRDLAMAMQELYNLSRELNGYCWTAQQINRDKTKGGPGINQVAGSKELATVASVIISMDMGEDKKEAGLVSFKLIKNRHGASGAKAEDVVTDLDCARVEAHGDKLW